MSNETDTRLTYAEFSPLSQTRRFTGLTRFGHSNNFTALFQEDEDVEDYFVGLIFVGCLIMSLFLVWALLLIVFKHCLQQEEVGFLSGSAFRAPRPPKSEAPVDVREAPPPVDGFVMESKMRWPNRPMRGRIVFLVSGIIYITFTALLVRKGITNLQSSVNTLNRSAQQIRLISVEAADIIQVGLRDLKDGAASIREQIADQFQGNSFCPADPALENSVLGRDVSGQADDAIILLDLLDDFASDDLANLEDGVLTVASRSLDVAEYTDDIDLNDWEALLILIPYIVVPSVLMSACVMALFDVEYHPFLGSAIHYFFLPLFIVMNVVAFMAAGIMVIGAGANADFCLPGGESGASPDDSVLQIMQLEGYGPETQAFAIFQYYIQKCSVGEDPFLFLRQYVADVVENDGGLNQLKSAIEGDGVLEELSLYCNRDFEPLNALVTQMLGILTILREAGERTLDLASCDRIVPIYTNTFYSGSCDYSLNAMIWLFACALTIGVFGMIMVTFRVAYKLTVFEDPIAVIAQSDDMYAPEVAEVRVANDDGDDDDFPKRDQPGEQRIQGVQAPNEEWADAYYSDYSNEKGFPVQVD